MIARFGETLSIGRDELRALVARALDAAPGPLRRVLILPPDHTRLNSQAGVITAMACEKLATAGARVDILPALGTHNAMSEKQLRMMFGGTIPLDAFRVHDWRNGIVRKGVVPGAMLAELSGGRVDYEVGVEVNRLLYDGYDLILSVGQVVPHEVVGMANYTKNILVGVGGSDIINKSHFIGASCNMEKIMGRADTPVRRLFNYGVKEFLGDLPITYMLTVMARNNDTGKMEMRGFFAGQDEEAYLDAVKLSQQTNLVLMDEPADKVVVFLDPEEFKSTWLGNKAVYRTRMMIADDGDLIILAPALKEFGEDKTNDAVIRKYGYKGTPATLKAVRENADLRENLGAAAHLIHGSSEGRFKITYCPGPNMSRGEIENAGFAYADYEEMMKKYDVANLKDGYNMVNGEKIFYISNPALGLWALRKNFS